MFLYSLSVNCLHVMYQSNAFIFYTVGRLFLNNKYAYKFLLYCIFQWMPIFFSSSVQLYD